jgi:hypothetical protein
MNMERYTGAIDAFDATFTEFVGGWADADGKAAARERLTAIAIAAGDLRYHGYFSGLHHELETYIDALYSPRKHLKYKRDSRSGVEELHFRILSCTGRLRTTPHMLESFKSFPEKS